MAPACVRFYTLTFSIVFGVPQVEREMNYIKYTKQREIPNLFEYFNLVPFYKQRSYREKISEKTTITGSDV